MDRRKKTRKGEYFKYLFRILFFPLVGHSISHILFSVRYRNRYSNASQRDIIYARRAHDSVAKEAQRFPFHFSFSPMRIRHWDAGEHRHQFTFLEGRCINRCPEFLRYLISLSLSSRTKWSVENVAHNRTNRRVRVYEFEIVHHANHAGFIINIYM